MTGQQTFTDAEYSARKRSGRREKFLTGADKLARKTEETRRCQASYLITGRDWRPDEYAWNSSGKQKQTG